MCDLPKVLGCADIRHSPKEAGKLGLEAHTRNYVKEELLQQSVRFMIYRAIKRHIGIATRVFVICFKAFQKAHYTIFTI